MAPLVCVVASIAVMGTILTTTLIVIVWLYAICVIKNGGGFVSAIAIVGTAVLAFAACAWLFSQGLTLYASLIILAIPAAFVVVIFDSNSDGGWIN